MADAGNIIVRLQQDLIEEDRKLGAALRELSEKQAQLNDAQIRVDVLRSKSDYIRSLLSGGARPVTATSGDVAKTIPKWIEEILRIAGKPLRMTEIVDRVMDAGFHGDKKKITAKFSSILSRLTKHGNHAVFKKVGRGMFDIHRQRPDKVMLGDDDGAKIGMTI